MPAANRTLSMRIAVDGGPEAKAALEGFKTSGVAATEGMKKSLEALASEDAPGRLAQQLGAAAAKINAAHQALAKVPTGDTAAQTAAMQQLTAATDAYARIQDAMVAKTDARHAAERQLASTLAEVAAAERLAGLSAERAADARSKAQATYFASLRSAGAAVDALRDRYVPLAGATRSSIDSQREINALFASGDLSSSEFAAAINKVTTSYRGLAAAAALAGQTERAEMAQRGQALANNFAGVGAGSSGTAAASAAAMSREFDQLRRGVDPVYAASKDYEAALEKVTEAQKKGVITTGQAKLEHERITEAYAKSIEPARQVAVVTGAAAAATRNLGIQVTQAISGIATGQPVLTTLIQQGHQVLDSSLAMGTGFKALGESAKGIFVAMGGLPVLMGAVVVGGLVALGKTAESEATRLGNLRQELRATQVDYEALAISVEATARKVAGSSTLGTADARIAAQTVASARYFDGNIPGLERLTRMSADLARVWGVDVVKASGALRDAIAEPAAAAQRFASQGMPEFNATLLRNVELLERSGHAGDATRTVIDALARNSAGASKDLSPLGKAIHELEESFYGAQRGGKSLATQLGDFVNQQVAYVVIGLNVVIDAIKRTSDTARNAAETARLNAIELAKVQPAGNAATTPDASGRPVLQGPPIAGSSERAIGIFQVLPSTGRELGYDVTRQDQNILAGLTYLQQQVQKRGSVDAGLAQYGGYGGNVAGAAGYIGKVQGASADKLPADLASQIEYWGQVLGMSPDMIALGKRLAVVESGGRQYARPGEAAGSQAALGSLAGGGSGAAGSGAAGAFAADFGARNAEQRRLLDGALADARGTRAFGSQENAADLARIRSEMDALAAAGQGASAQMAGLRQREQELLAAERERLDPQQKFLQGLHDQVAAGQGVYAGDQKIVQLRQQMAEIERSQGGTFSAVQRAEAEGQALALQSQEYRRLVANMELATQASGKITAAYGQGYSAVYQVTAEQQAYQEALRQYPKDSESFKSAFADLTERYKAQALAAREVQIAQSTLGNKDQVASIEAEARTLGMASEARTAYLAQFKAEQELKKQGIALESELGQSYLASVATLTQVTTAYERQQTALSELSGFVDHTFSTISDGIVQAMATSEQSMVKLEQVGKAVMTSLKSEFVKLAAINPLKNALFGTNGATLDSVGGLLGSLFTGTGSTVQPTATAAGVSSLESMGLFKPISGLSEAQLAEAANAGAKAGQTSTIDAVGSVASLVSKFGMGTGGTLSSISNATLYSSTAGLQGPTATGATLDSAAGAVQGGGIGVTLGQAAGIAGGLYGAYSGFERGGAGGYTQAAAGIAGAGLAAAGTGILGASAYGAAAALGPYAPIAIAAVALLSAFLPGAHPKNPYQNTAIDIAGGQVVAGKQVSQIETTAAAAAQVETFSQTLNSYMDTVGIKLSNLDSHLGDVGRGIKGMTQVGSVLDLFSKLQFDTDAAAPDAASNFGVARHALAGMTFASPEALNEEMLKIGAFATGLDALGLHLGSVGKDLSSISIASVDLADAMGERSNLRLALSNDLPKKVFATADALSAEIEKVHQFVDGTMVGLLNPVVQTQSDFLKTLAESHKQYDGAIYQASQYGLDLDPLFDAKRRADDLLYAPQRKALDQANNLVVDQGIAADTSLSSADRFAAQFDAARVQAAQKRDQVAESMKAVYGDAVESTRFYWDRLGDYDQAVARQTEASIVAFQRQQRTGALSIAALVNGIQARAAVLAGDQTGADLLNADVKAAQERESVGNQLADFFGESYRASAEYQSRMTELERVQQGERLAIANKAADALKAQATSAVGTLLGSIGTYARSLETGDANPASPSVRYATAQREFDAVSGAAAAGDYASAGKLTNYADTLLTTSRAMFGSTAAYARDYARVVDALASVGDAADALTVSAQRSIAQEQTKELTTAFRESISDLKAEVAALRKEVQHSQLSAA